MKFTQIKESCLYVEDIDRSEHFYHQMLGLPVISKVEKRHIFFRAGSSVLLCFIPEATRNEKTLPPHYASGKQHLAFEVGVHNYLETRELLIQKGITITHEQAWKESLKSIYFEDPDGHVLEIVPVGIWE